VLKNKRIFYGWLLVGAAALALANTTGLMVNSYSQFIKPVSEQFGFARSEFVLYATLQTLAIMLLVPLNAAIFARINPPMAIILGGILAAACWAGFSLADSLFHFYILGLGVGAGLAFVGTVTMNMVISNWFIAKKGLAIGLTLIGSGIGAMAWNPILAHLIIAWGPQAAYRVSGLIALALMLPLFILFRFHPKDIGLEPLGAQEEVGSAGAVMEEDGVLYAEAVRSRRFWILALALAFFPFSMLGVFTQLQPFLTDLGFPAMFAAVAISVGGFFQVANRPVLGALHDRLGTRTLFILAVGLCSGGLLGVTMLACFPAVPLPFLHLAAALFGAAAASPTVIAPLVVGAAFGRKDFAAIYGTVASLWYIGPAAGPLFAALIFDLTGSYVPAFLVFMVGMPVVLFFGLRSLKPGR
jgi:MFS family permease